MILLVKNSVIYVFSGFSLVDRVGPIDNEPNMFGGRLVRIVLIVTCNGYSFSQILAFDISAQIRNLNLITRPGGKSLQSLLA